MEPMATGTPVLFNSEVWVEGKPIAQEFSGTVREAVTMDGAPWDADKAEGEQARGYNISFGGTFVYRPESAVRRA